MSEQGLLLKKIKGDKIAVSNFGLKVCSYGKEEFGIFQRFS